MHRRFQIDIDICEVKGVKYNTWLLELVDIVNAYDDRGLNTNVSDFKCWEVVSYYIGSTFKSPVLEVEDYGLLDSIYSAIDRKLTPYTSFNGRKTSYHIEAFDLKAPQISFLAKRFFASLNVFRKMNQDKDYLDDVDFDFSDFDPMKIDVSNTELYPLFENAFTLSFSKFAKTGMISFSVAQACFKSEQILNWLKLFTHMVEKSKNLPEARSLPQVETGKEFIRQWEIDKSLGDWILKLCAE